MDNIKANRFLEARALEYRKENFDVSVEPHRSPIEHGEILLRITHNGYQWETVSLLRSEVSKVIAALSPFAEKE
jgi:hypothetical protein